MESVIAQRIELVKRTIVLQNYSQSLVDNHPYLHLISQQLESISQQVEELLNEQFEELEFLVENNQVNNAAK